MKKPKAIEREERQRTDSAMRWVRVGDLRKADEATWIVVNSFLFFFEEAVDAERRLPDQRPGEDPAAWLVRAAQALGAHAFNSPRFRHELAVLCYGRQRVPADPDLRQKTGKALRRMVTLIAGAPSGNPNFRRGKPQPRDRKIDPDNVRAKVAALAKEFEAQTGIRRGRIKFAQEELGKKFGVTSAAIAKRKRA